MMRFKKVVGLMGGMGAGKSTLVSWLTQRNIPIFDVDAKVHDLYEDQEIRDDLGKILHLPQPVTRQHVAQLIVEKPEALQLVESLIGGSLARALANELTKTHEPFLVIDAPMLVEMNWTCYVDFVIGVICPREIREKRVAGRPDMTPEKMKLLMDRQLTDEQRLQHCHWTIDNSGNLVCAIDELSRITNKLRAFYA